MYQKLLDLEISFFKKENIADRRWLDKVIHDEFTEFGKSGRLYGKKETIEGLLACGQDRDIELFDFGWESLARDCWLVHYVTREIGGSVYRTSIWVENSCVFQLRHHQASWMKEEVST